MNHVPALTALILRRLSREGLTPDAPIAVAELHRRLVPYALCREALGLTTKAEYDLALLRLLNDEQVTVEEKALRDAVRRELDSPEPGLAILQRFAASEIRVRGPDSIVSEKSRADGPAAPKAPPRVDLETERMPQDRIRGLDDQEFQPETEPPPIPGSVPDPDATRGPAGVSDRGPEKPAELRPNHCHSCQEKLPERAGLRFCPSCGADQYRWPCPACGETVERGWKYCAMCGARQSE
ncbi:MAG: zinc ribbon domain-containing protein [Gemmatimonadota bacterium]